MEHLRFCLVRGRENKDGNLYNLGEENGEEGDKYLSLNVLGMNSSYCPTILPTPEGSKLESCRGFQIPYPIHSLL